MDDMKIRKATTSDIPVLVKFRRAMFESMGHTDVNKLDKGDSAAEKYFNRSIPDKTFFGWVAVDKTGLVISCIGVVIDQHPPGPHNLSGKIAYVMNLYTLPEYRRRGIAKSLMEEVINWVKENKITRISLHASEMGRNLYNTLGFTTTNALRLKLGKNDSNSNG